MLAVLLAILATFAAWRGHPRRAAFCGGGVAVVLGLRFVAFPLWLRFFRLRMQFAEMLGRFSTVVILVLVYYLVVTPVGLFFRTLRRDPLDLKFRDARDTYWIAKEPVEPTLGRYRKQF